MTRVGMSRLYILTGLLTLFAFCGDIIADSVADACCDHCASQTSQSDSTHPKAPCSNCACAFHNSALVASNSSVSVRYAPDVATFVVISDETAPPGLPAAIDHPPQLLYA